MRDGFGFKFSFEYYERKKVFVGLKKKIDIDYIKKNFVLDFFEFKKSMIKDVDILVVIIVDRKISFFVGVNYEIVD